jgi:hypothetical protein
MNAYKQFFPMLLKQADFLENLKLEFEEDADNILKMMAGDVEWDNELDISLEDFINNRLSGYEILTIGWDSTGFGPGGNGFIAYSLRWNICQPFSSDLDLEPFEYDLKKFDPTDELVESGYDSLSISSAFFDEAYLITLASNISGSDIDVTINGRKYYFDNEGHHTLGID